jgi:hypothetical protein
VTDSRGPEDYLKLGDWNAVCYQCGRKKKAGELWKYWEGYYVCPEHWEVRQPQDFVRGVPDTQTPPWTQPMPADEWAAGSPDLPMYQPTQYPIIGNE